MGSWGVGPFENDWAADWIVDESDGSLVAHLVTLHESVVYDLEHHDRLSDATAAKVVAAAEICTWMFRRGRFQVPEAAWHLLSATPRLTSAHIEMVRADLDLVAESERPERLFDTEGWNQMYSDLRRRLAPPGAASRE